MNKFFNKTTIILIFILLLGAIFRFYDINWDQGTHLHPDERAIILYTLPLNLPTSFSEFLSPASPLNPHFFAYGNFPLYVLKLAGNTAGLFNKSFESYNGIELVGRGISGIADLLTILLIFLIAKDLLDERSALAASLLYSFSVFAIQTSHFFAVDILLTFFITLVLYRLIKFYKKSNFINAAWVGISFGAALATKISAAPLVLAVLTAISLDFLLIFLKNPHKPKLWLPHIPNFLFRLLKDGFVTCLSTLITFVVLEPYALVDFKEFLNQNLQQSEMTKSAYTFPYTLQYVGKTPYFYEIKNIFLWGMGPAIALFAVGGIIYFFLSFKRLSENKKYETFIIISFAAVYFLIVGKFAVGWMRYMLPIYPILAIFGGLFLTKIERFIQRIKIKSLRKILYIAIFLAVIYWPLSFISIYTKINSRVAATNWINNNIPNGSSLTHEVWDDALPLYTNNQYTIVDLSLYDQPDNEAKWNILNSKIENADYLIISSNRLYVPIEKLADCGKYQECFPIASKFYENLFAGRLNFKEVARFSSFPTLPLLNIPINDQGADESFTVYDHPVVFIFKNTRL